MLAAFPLDINDFTWQTLPRCWSLSLSVHLISLALQMGMSPSRIPQNQGMMGSHANNMVSQPPSQGQFLPQGQFPVGAGGAMNVNMSLGPTMSQGAVTQVRRNFFYSPNLFITCCLFLSEHDLSCVTAASFPLVPAQLDSVLFVFPLQLWAAPARCPERPTMPFLCDFVCLWILSSATEHINACWLACSHFPCCQVPKTVGLIQSQDSPSDITAWPGSGMLTSHFRLDSA